MKRFPKKFEDMDADELRELVKLILNGIRLSPHDPNCPLVHPRFNGRCHCPWRKILSVLP